VQIHRRLKHYTCWRRRLAAPPDGGRGTARARAPIRKPFPGPGFGSSGAKNPRKGAWKNILYIKPITYYTKSTRGYHAGQAPEPQFG